MEVQLKESSEQGAMRLAAFKLKEGYELTAIHVYRDKNGVPIYEKIRCENKKTGEKWVRPMQLVGNQYVPEEPVFPKGQKPLYKLDQIYLKEKDIIHIVEGEKVVDALAKIGVLATTSGSATSASSADWSILKGWDVIVWRDNDASGLKYAQEVTESLTQWGCGIVWMDISKLNLPEGGDFVDWIEQHIDATSEDVFSLPHIEPMQNDKSIHNFEFRMDVPIGFDQIITPIISADFLSNELKQYARELAQSTETDESMAVMTELAVISSIISKKFVVNPKPDWEQSTNLYMMIVSPPGTNKSQVLNACIEPLELLEKEKEQELLPLIKRQKSKKASDEARIMRMRSLLAKEDNELERDILQDRIDNLEASITEIQSIPKYYVNDATPESLVQILKEQGNHISIVSDEGGILETLAGLYTKGKSSNIDIVLKGIDGGRIRKKRIGTGGETETTLKPYLTILLVVQPIVIDRIRSKEAYQDNGFLERFLYIRATSTLGSRTHNTPSISQQTRERYHAFIRKLVSLCDNTENAHKEKLTLEPNAFEKWHEFIIWLESELAANGKLAAFPGWGSKLKGFVLAIAACLHISEFFEATLIISESTMKRAIDLAFKLVEHSRAISTQMRLSQEQTDALTCWECISSLPNSIFKMADLTIGLRHKKRMTKLQKLAALEVLKDMGLISESVQIPGKKTILFQRQHCSIS